MTTPAETRSRPAPEELRAVLERCLPRHRILEISPGKVVLSLDGGARGLATALAVTFGVVGTGTAVMQALHVLGTPGPLDGVTFVMAALAATMLGAAALCWRWRNRIPVSRLAFQAPAASPYRAGKGTVVLAHGEKSEIVGADELELWIRVERWKADVLPESRVALVLVRPAGLWCTVSVRFPRSPKETPEEERELKEMADDLERAARALARCTDSDPRIKRDVL